MKSSACYSTNLLQYILELMRHRCYVAAPLAAQSARRPRWRDRFADVRRARALRLQRALWERAQRRRAARTQPALAAAALRQLCAALAAGRAGQAACTAGACLGPRQPHPGARLRVNAVCYMRIACKHRMGVAAEPHAEHLRPDACQVRLPW